LSQKRSNRAFRRQNWAELYKPTPSQKYMYRMRNVQRLHLKAHLVGGLKRSSFSTSAITELTAVIIRAWPGSCPRNTKKVVTQRAPHPLLKKSYLCVRVRNPDSSVSSSLPGLKARRGQHLCPCARGRARGRLDRSALLLPLHSPRALCRTQTLCRRQDMSPSPNSCAVS